MPVVKIQPVLNNNNLSRFLGDQTGQTFSHLLKAKVKYWKNRMRDIVEPKLTYQVKKVSKISKGRISLEEDCHFKSPKLSKTLSSSKEIVCFLATVGPRIEKEISKLFKKNHLADAYVLDAMGSAAVENMVEQFQSGISEKYNKEGSCLMTPSKSISGVFGIQSDYEKGKKPYNPCWDCNKMDCSERRSPMIKRKKT